MENCVKSFVLVFVLVLFSISGMAQSKPQRDVSKDRKPMVLKPRVATFVPNTKKQLLANNKQKRTVVKRKVASSSKPQNTYKQSQRIKNDEPSLAVSASELIFDFKGEETKNIYVKAKNNLWYLTGVPEWCKISYNRDLNFFSITCLENGSEQAKCVTFYVHSGGQTIPVYVSQSGAPAVCASISHVSILHNECVKNEQCLVISGIVKIPISYRCNFYVEAFFYDSQYNCIKAHWAYPDYQWHSTDFLFLKSEPFTSTPQQLYYYFRMVLPNKAIVVPKDDIVLNCILNVHNSADESLVSNSNYSFYIRVKRKKDKIKTMDIQLYGKQ